MLWLWTYFACVSLTCFKEKSLTDAHYKMHLCVYCIPSQGALDAVHITGQLDTGLGWTVEQAVKGVNNKQDIQYVQYRVMILFRSKAKNMYNSFQEGIFDCFVMHAVNYWLQKSHQNRE